MRNIKHLTNSHCLHGDALPSILGFLFDNPQWRPALRAPSRKPSLRKTSTTALDTGLGLHGVDVAAEQPVMAPSCLSECPLLRRVSGASGHIAGIAKTALMTRRRHWLD